MVSTKRPYILKQNCRFQLQACLIMYYLLIDTRCQRVKACVRYFSLFLKEQCASWLFRTKYFEKKFNLLLFYLPTVSWTFFSSGLPRATHLIETSSEKITACVIETILVTLPLVPMNKARRKVSQQIKYNSTQDKIATVLRTYLNDWKNVLPLFKL